MSKKYKDMKQNSSNIYNISTIYNKSQNNLKTCLKKLNYQQQIRLSTVGHDKSR